MKLINTTLKQFLVLATICCLPLKTLNAQDRFQWQEISTTEEVSQAYPERMQFLLESMDLDRKGLEEAKTAFERENISGACELLLDYYRNSENAKFLRRDLPALSNKTDSEADSIIKDIFTVQLQAGQAPRNQDGHLDWHYQGPKDDKEWAWGVNRHYHLRTLLETYFKTGNPKYAQTIDLHIKDWVLSSLPYPREKRSTAMWRGLEVSFRVKNWARIFYSLLHDKNLSPATRLLLLSSIPEHAHYARNFHAAGNWLTMEMSGLAMAAMAWPEFRDSPQWIAYTKEAMTASLEKQVYPDGVQTELTSHYHYVALNNFNLFSEICQAANEPLPGVFSEGIEKMWNYLAYSMRPDGYGPLNNDSDRDYNRNRIVDAVKQYDRPDWEYIGTNGKMGKEPETGPSAVFPWAGQMIMRSGFQTDAQWAFFDMGPWGSGHQHNDKLHVSISAYGRDFLVDGGRFAYRGAIADKFRGYARGSQSHNVILIDGNGQANGPKVADEALSSGHYKTTPDFDYAWASMDQFKDIEGESKHTRSVFYQHGKFWVIADCIDTDRPRKIEALWHWHPDCEVKTGKKNTAVTDHDRGNLSIVPVGYRKWKLKQVKGQENPGLQGWYSEEYNKYEANTTSIFTTEIKKNTTFIWLICPSEDRAYELKAKVLSKNENGVTVRVEEAGEQWEIFIPFADSEAVKVSE